MEVGERSAYNAYNAYNVLVQWMFRDQAKRATMRSFILRLEYR
jgi:hypothetical protein